MSWVGIGVVMNEPMPYQCFFLFFKASRAESGGRRRGATNNSVIIRQQLP